MTDALQALLGTPRERIARYLTVTGPAVAADGIGRLMDRNAELRELLDLSRQSAARMRNSIARFLIAQEWSDDDDPYLADSLDSFSAGYDTPVFQLTRDLNEARATIARIEGQRCAHDNCRKPLAQHEGHRWCNDVDLGPQEFLTAKGGE